MPPTLSIPLIVVLITLLLVKVPLAEPAIPPTSLSLALMVAVTLQLEKVDDDAFPHTAPTSPFPFIVVSSMTMFLNVALSAYPNSPTPSVEGRSMLRLLIVWLLPSKMP